MGNLRGLKGVLSWVLSMHFFTDVILGFKAFREVSVGFRRFQGASVKFEESLRGFLSGFKASWVLRMFNWA